MPVTSPPAFSLSYKLVVGSWMNIRTHLTLKPKHLNLQLVRKWRPHIYSYFCPFVSVSSWAGSRSAPTMSCVRERPLWAATESTRLCLRYDKDGGQQCLSVDWGNVKIRAMTFPKPVQSRSVTCLCECHSLIHNWLVYLRGHSNSFEPFCGCWGGVSGPTNLRSHIWAVMSSGRWRYYDTRLFKRSSKILRVKP